MGVYDHNQFILNKLKSDRIEVLLGRKPSPEDFAFDTGIYVEERHVVIIILVQVCIYLLWARLH